ncbi:hypothetical protein F4553_004824 [Allocatelliglobosispora scoriae]|uniref:Uncharacterized protein n=1 Tax=Allocatelliglobosispora scoriae TaxID=643052 RepID=A0A841BUT3_9ACTN|nr:lysylphosphatidylglycerol synthase domain-containing protein [Allocatelliglobosispora scoriae]MBB5871445.1 hypothetical protein [Allocatelliglobosispora scoriae]
MSAIELQDGGEPDLGGAEAGGAEPERRWRVLRRRAVTVFFLVATAAAIAAVLHSQDWSVLATTMRDRPAGFFAVMVGLALLANGAALLASMRAWLSMLSGVTGDVAATDSARIFFAGQFAKYMPGKIFGYVVSVRMGKTLGVSTVRMTSAWMLTLVIGLLTGATVGLLAGPQVLGGSVAWLALAALPIVAVLIRPDLISWAAVVVARLLRRPPPTVRLPGSVIRRNVVMQLMSWLLGGVQLWFLAIAMGAPPAGSLLLCVGAFGLGTVAGVFAVFAPEGLGVREFVLLTALSVTLSLPAAGVVALVSRLVVILSELATAGVGLLVIEVLRRRRARRPGERHLLVPAPDSL